MIKRANSTSAPALALRTDALKLGPVDKKGFVTHRQDGLYAALSWNASTEEMVVQGLFADEHVANIASSIAQKYMFQNENEARMYLERMFVKRVLQM